MARATPPDRARWSIETSTGAAWARLVVNMAAAVAGRSGEMALVTTLALATLRGPVPLAKALSALDIISGGRLELGIGAGWNEEESDAYGLDLGANLTERFDRFAHRVLGERYSDAAAAERQPVAIGHDINGIAHGVAGLAPLLDVGEPMVQCFDQQVAPLRVVEQVLLEVRVAPHDPDVAEHFVQHACRTASAAFGAEIVEQRPAFGAEQADHDLAVRERGVVVGDLAQTHRLGGLRLQGRDRKSTRLYSSH